MRSCDASPLLPILYMGGAALLILSAFIFYTWLIQKYPEALRGGISTFSILYHHAQTVSIFAELHLDWPPTVLKVLEAMSINLFSIEIGRPECLIGEVDEGLGGPFYMINMCKFIGLLAIFVLLFLTQRACWLRGYAKVREERAEVKRRIRSGQQVDERARERRKRRLKIKNDALVDKIEMIESIVFGMQLTMSWKIIFQFIEARHLHAAVPHCVPYPIVFPTSPATQPPGAVLKPICSPTMQPLYLCHPQASIASSCTGPVGWARQGWLHR